MNVLVVGSTGRLGSEVVRQALAAGHQVTALARNPPSDGDGPGGARVDQGDVLDRASLERAAAGQEAVVSCLGTRDRKESSLRTEGTRNLIAAIKGAGARRLIVFSAFGVGDSRDQLNRTTFFFGRIIMPLLLKAQFEDMDRMEAAVRDSGLEWVIVRPTALTEKPGGEEVKVSVDGAGKASSQIPIPDVARFMVGALTDDTHLHQSPVIFV